MTEMQETRELQRARRIHSRRRAKERGPHNRREFRANIRFVMAGGKPRKVDACT